RMVWVYVGVDSLTTDTIVHNIRRLIYSQHNIVNLTMLCNTKSLIFLPYLHQSMVITTTKLPEH
ncbi:MAG: hypothetical protein J7K33_06590, partial [Candidatus Marinimicrobia bacterium]|nr:hypothetical protein [Candidatus Neomarinimicrobiota bacterium]